MLAVNKLSLMSIQCPEYNVPQQESNRRLYVRYPAFEILSHQKTLQKKDLYLTSNPVQLCINKVLISESLTREELR